MGYQGEREQGYNVGYGESLPKAKLPPKKATPKPAKPKIAPPARRGRR
jgi:hypothetical protein